MNIGQAAEASGLPVKTLRYYETLGLVVPVRQAGNDYREYTLNNIEHLRFLQRGRAAGFSLDECRQLLALYLDDQGADPGWLQDRITSLDTRMHALEAMRQTLVTMLTNTRPGARLPTDVNHVESVYQGGMPFMLVDSNE